MNDNIIEINLSEKYKEKKKKKEPVLKIPNALGVVVMIVIVAFAVSHLLLYLRENSLKKMTARFNELKAPAKEAARLKKMSQDLSKRKEALNGCKENWNTWAGKWLELAKLTPDSIFLQEIKISVDNVPDGKQTVLIRGRASGKEGESVILNYLEALKTSKVFNTKFKKMVLSPVYTEGNQKVFSIDLIQ